MPRKFRELKQNKVSRLNMAISEDLLGELMNLARRIDVPVSTVAKASICMGFHAVEERCNQPGTAHLKVLRKREEMGIYRPFGRRAGHK